MKPKVGQWLVLGVVGGAAMASGALPHLVTDLQAGMAASSSGGTSAAVTASKVTGGSEAAFFRAALADLGAPATPANLASLEAWTTHEWPAWPPKATNNPLDTTLPAPGATAFNTFTAANGATLHVWSYPDATTGAAETARTIAGGNFPRIESALRDGRGVCGGGFAGEFSAWSGGGYRSVC